MKATEKVESSDEEEEVFEPCRQKFDSEIEIDPLDSLEDKITKLILRQEKSVKSLEFTQWELEDLKKQNAGLKSYVEDLELETNRNKYAIERSVARIEKVDNATRRKNLLIEGIAERPNGNENLDQIISDLFGELGIDTRVEFDQLYRVGSFNPKFKRPIFISFIHADDRGHVFDKRAKLRRSKVFHDIWVSDDVTPTARRTKALIRQVTREAKNQGSQCTSTQYSVTINSQNYDETSLNCLPRELSLESIKTKQIGDDVIAYHSEHSPMSNLFPAPIKIGKRTFNSLEQAFHYKKARGHNNDEIAEKIYLCREPYDIRILGKKITPSQKSIDNEQEIMFELMIRKFEQNPLIRAKLLDTAGKTLVEATPDRTWGAGCSIFSPALRNKTWPGLNRQGKLLMRARDTLIAKYKKD